MIKKNEIIDIIDSVKIGNSPVIDSSNLIGDGILDSFSILVFVAELNSKYGYNISLDQQVNTIFMSVDSIYDYIMSKV
jgi:acyl carrier protein